MCPFSTETDPNRFRYASACTLSSVPHPHSGYTDHSGMCAKTTIGVLLFRCLTSFSSPLELIWVSPLDFWPRTVSDRGCTDGHGACGSALEARRYCVRG